VRTIGNLFFSGKSEQSIALARIDGLGSFSILPDDLILSFLSYIERAEDLCALMATSKFFYVFCQEQENWKERVLAEFKVPVTILRIPPSYIGITKLTHMMWDLLHREIGIL